ncbi:hypothetical protein ABIF69_004496 [Bradyrhizobium japonicum]
METLKELLIILAYVVLLIGFVFAVVALGDSYLGRWFQPEPKLDHSTPVAGISATGERTTAAKYALGTYRLGIFITGTIVGILSGIAGHMISNFAGEKAVKVAINPVQAPLIERLGQFEEAKAALNTAISEVANTDKFVRNVVHETWRNSEFRTKLVNTLVVQYGEQLINNADFRSQLANLLATRYGDQVRGPQGDVGPPGPVGPRGDAGPAGKDGQDGVSASAAEVAAAVNREDFRNQLANLLATRHGDQVRGPHGDVGPPGPVGPRGGAGPAGKDGKDGVSASAAEVAAAVNREDFRNELADLLATRHGDQVRGPRGDVGPPGPVGPQGEVGRAGKDGKDGVSASAAEVAAVVNREDFRKELANLLATRHGDQVRGPHGDVGPPGPVGPRGDAGPAGKDGKDGVSASAAEVAAAVNREDFRKELANLLATRHGDQVRGPQGDVGPPGPVGPQGEVGRAGKDGKDGVSPRRRRSGGGGQLGGFPKRNS